MWTRVSQHNVLLTLYCRSGGGSSCTTTPNASASPLGPMFDPPPPKNSRVAEDEVKVDVKALNARARRAMYNNLVPFLYAPVLPMSACPPWLNIVRS